MNTKHKQTQRKKSHVEIRRSERVEPALVSSNGREGEREGEGGEGSEERKKEWKVADGLRTMMGVGWGWGGVGQLGGGCRGYIIVYSFVWVLGSTRGKGQRKDCLPEALAAASPGKFP